MPRRQRLRRTEAVEAAGKIRPLWVAEINRAVRETHGVQRNPSATHIRACFNHNGNVRRPNDVETKAVRLDTKANTTRLRLGIPQFSS